MSIFLKRSLAALAIVAFALIFIRPDTSAPVEELSRNRLDTLIEQHRRDYNERRPHSSLGYKTPREFARKHQAMESAGMWKAAEKRAFPQALENAPHSPRPAGEGSR